MSQQGTMLSTIICLLPLFSHLQPATGETTGELLQSIGRQTHKESFNEIVCTFNVKVSLSRVDFVDKTGSPVFAIVDCGTSCNVLSSYQDVLRIVSPEKTISGDRFVFNATHSDRTTGTYTCHGITAPEVVDTSPSGTGDGDGEENQMTSVPPYETDEVSHNAGGGSNGLLALIIIPILVVLIGVVLFLHWWGVIQIPGLPKTRGEPRDLRRIVGNLHQPVTRCWERTRGLCQSTRADNQDPPERRKSNRDQDEEASLKDKELIAQNEDNQFLHLGAAPEKFKSDLPYPVKESLDYEGNDNEVSVVEERQPLLRDPYHNTKPTHGGNVSIEEYQTSPQSTLSPNSTDTKEKDSNVEDRQTSPQSLHLSSSTKDFTADLSAASLSRDSIQHKEESPHTKIHSSAPHDTGTPTSNPKPPIPQKPVDLMKKPSVNRPIALRPRNAESGYDDVNKTKISGDPGVSLQHTPQTSGTRLETERENDESMNGQLQTARNTKGRERTEEREGDRGRVDMKEEKSSEAKSETINNEDMKGQLTSYQNKEDMGGKKERHDDNEEVKIKEKETSEINSVTESKEDGRHKQKGIEQTMAAEVEQEHKEEAKKEVEHSQKLEAEPVTEQRDNNEDDDYQTASDDDDNANRSRNAEGAVDVDKLDGARSTGQNLVYTDLSLPEHSQECSDGEKRQTIRGRLKSLSSKYNQFDDDNLNV